MVAKKAKLRAGIGARATILTRYIKPLQPLQGGNKKHRSEIILKERYLDKKNKVFYRFKYALDLEGNKPHQIRAGPHQLEYGNSPTKMNMNTKISADPLRSGAVYGPLMHASTHWIKLTKEGHHHDLFDGPGEPPEVVYKEPKIKWRHSRARKLLYNDIVSKNIEFDEDGKPMMDLREIYVMHVEYAEYLFDRFEERMEALRQLFESQVNRAEDDCTALQKYINNHEVSQVTFKGLIQWQGSEAQVLAIQDIDEEVYKEVGYRAMYDRRREYFEYFPYADFKQKVRQEIRNEKRIQTMKVRDMQGMQAT